MAATEQTLRSAPGSGDAMHALRLALSDTMRVALLSDQEIVRYLAKVRDSRSAFTTSINVSGLKHIKLPAHTNLDAGKLRIVFPNADPDYLSSVALELNRDLKLYGLDSPLRQAHFFAQLREESGADLSKTVENLNYNPAVLPVKFGYYKRHKDEAKEDGYAKDEKTKKITRKADEETIANKVYADRNGNGGIDSGDGWKFRGRGLIQITGRTNYAALTKKYGELYLEKKSIRRLSFVSNPELLAEFPYSLRSAICYWKIHKLHRLADRGHADADVDRITKVINAGTDSYGKRCEHFQRAYSAFS
ncbi:glycoside hydrolase family 19 protein [Methylobacterium sp. J-068]|uniref:glycoside hydrolase family 19 protein n=1 Tax=Methylobacterium sp. J-068 TaxID=2836649 RepID=UPI001FBB17C6|nr:hypothetical protein [Methylobacterium sp. J-068]MCJ2034315.1 hypothetical protein [Methylobacterium sp. J-068]